MTGESLDSACVAVPWSRGLLSAAVLFSFRRQGLRPCTPALRSGCRRAPPRLLLVAPRHLPVSSDLITAGLN
jgi:hypothetical protein